MESGVCGTGYPDANPNTNADIHPNADAQADSFANTAPTECVVGWFQNDGAREAVNGIV
jgi:hypothetical protein